MIKKEIDEVKKIIAEGGAFQDYIKEVDLLDDDFGEEDITENHQPQPENFGLAPPPSKGGVKTIIPGQNNQNSNTNNTNNNHENFDLLDLTSGPPAPVKNEPILGMEPTNNGNAPQLGVTGTITYNGGVTGNAAPVQENNLTGFTQKEFDLVNMNNMGN